jgi:hypothetical protein
LSELRKAVERGLGIPFKLHESGYRGGDYFLGGNLGSEEFVIQLNRSEYEGEDEITESEYPEYPVIFSIGWTERGDELKRKLASIPGLDFLGREVRRP